MQHDMMMRGLSPRTQHQYVRNVQRFAAFLKRPPDTATSEDLRNFQIHQHEAGASVPTINGTVSALRFFYTVTLRRRDLARGVVINVASISAYDGPAAGFHMQPLRSAAPVCPTGTRHCTDTCL
jgi:site-specific recombinase XerD